jgi:hypothetical protein
VRNITRLKLGYYPLPDAEAHNLRRLLTFPEERASVLDPCVGTGRALHLITGDVKVEKYGVELDILLHLDAEQRGVAWVTIVSLLGLPADPRWGGPLLESLCKDKQMRRLEGLNCMPYAVTCNKSDLMTRLGDMLRRGELPFPEKNGPVLWPAFFVQNILTQIGCSEANQEAVPAAE